MAADLTEDKGARAHAEQWQAEFNRGTQSFWIEVPTKADGPMRILPKSPATSSRQIPECPPAFFGNRKAAALLLSISQDCELCLEAVRQRGLQKTGIR
jgi:hypothetical protein